MWAADMPDPNPTISELCKAHDITDEQVNAAVEFYLKNPEAGVHPIADGYSVDLAAAVAGHFWANSVVSHPEASMGQKHAAAQTAILLARAQKAWAVSNNALRRR